MTVRTRFAPSPTGYLHIGGIRQVLYCYALAKKHNGQFILRIEDTDRNRYVEGAVDTIFKVLDEYGLVPNESSRHGGEYGPYVQSERLEMYQSHAHELVERGAAYYCFLTPEETKQLQEGFIKENKRFRSPYREQKVSESKKMIEEGKPYTVRLKVPFDTEIEFTDDLQGHMKFHTNEVDDGVLLKQDGYPTYHLAVVIDDRFMKISHVFRGVEWISSVPKHVLIHDAFGWKMPKMYHLPLILDPEGGKLSKRKGATSAEEFLTNGYLPEAINNFLMLLGWSSPEERVHGEKERELYALDEFIELFDLKDLNKSSPTFNPDKLIWFNKEYIQKLSAEEFLKRFVDWVDTNLEDESLKHAITADAGLDKKLPLVQERIKLLGDGVDMINFFYQRPDNIDWSIKQLKRVSENIVEIKKAIFELIESFDTDTEQWTHETWEEGMRAIGDKFEAKHGDVFMVLRVAMTGGPFSPPLFESLQILDKEEVLKRLK